MIPVYLHIYQHMFGSVYVTGYKLEARNDGQRPERRRRTDGVERWNENVYLYDYQEL